MKQLRYRIVIYFLLICLVTANRVEINPIVKCVVMFHLLKFSNFSGVFVTASKNASGGYEYNTTLVVFLSELLKLVASATLYSFRRK